MANTRIRGGAVNSGAVKFLIIGVSMHRGLERTCTSPDKLMKKAKVHWREVNHRPERYRSSYNRIFKIVSASSVMLRDHS